MKKITLLSVLFLFTICFTSNAQSTINITTTGGSFSTEKWVNITTAIDGGGTQVWGQGNGTYGDSPGLLNVDIPIAPGTYYVNCYDKYADGWDGTLISITAYASVLNDNGGSSPDDGTDDDASSAFGDTQAQELEASLMIVVPVAPTDTPDWYNIQWIADNDNATGSDTSLTTDAWTSVTVYAQVWEDGVTDPAGQAAGIECWIGGNDDNDTDPSTWAEDEWDVAVYDSDQGNNDQYKLDAVLEFSGTVYIAARWRLNGGPYVYGGFNGPWNGTTNNNIELIVNPLVANDNCDGAIGLTVNADLACGTVTAGTIALATESGVDNCNGTEDDDVWYSFVATSTSHVVDITNIAGSTTDLYHAVYNSTPGCGSLAAALTCSDPNTSTTSGLTIGVTYYVQVYSWTGTTGQTSTFDICIGTPPPPAPVPANDDCVDAIALTPGNVFGDNPLDGSVESATVGSETATCGSNGPGIWYSIVVPADGNITIEVGPDAGTGDTGFDSVIEAFTGSCGALVSIDCDDDGAATGSFSMLDLTGLNPGSTIYVRVWEYGGNDIEPFAISAYNASLSVEDNIIEGFKMYPNPVNDVLSFRALDNIETISIYNLLGQEVMRMQPQQLQTQVDMSNLPTGMYVVKVQVGEQLGSYRVVKQ